ncbi:MAG: 50S ribosomal protein L9 [Lachnospiraceae bacterium]|nr:50S ribosomal protein L9 [Lachnospiraceae bacterium]
MKVILLEDVKSVGKKGQVVNASEGYAKNFLFPKKLAVEANNVNMNELNLKNKAEERKKAQELEDAKALAEKLEKIVVKIPVKTGEGGKLFGSVTNKEIAQAIEKNEGLKVDKKKIVLNDQIKMTGKKTVQVKLHPKVTAALTVEIVEG